MGEDFSPKIMKILKMKTYFFLITLFLFQFINSQNKFGKINYKIILLKDSTLISKSDRFTEMFNNAEIGSKEIELELIFNDSISKFYPIEKISNRNIKTALSFCNCGISYYTSLNRKKIFYNNNQSSMGIVAENEFLIYEIPQNDWVVYNEIKKIESFTCYKATKNIEFFNSKGKQTKTITAWFSPELPFSYGPIGYFGLPGLILELQDKNTIFIAKKIDISLNKTTIDLPKNGELISNFEYQKILEERYKKIKD